MDNGGPYNRRVAPTVIIALFVMFNTLGPILAPPTNLINASNPSPGMTEAEFRVKQVATNIFWAFSNSAFALALAAVLLQVGKLVGHGASEVCETVSLMLVMFSLLFMSFAAMGAVVVRLCPSSLVSAFSLVQGLCLLLSAYLCSCVFIAEIVG
ncbi:unnamed protein product [Eruca vesicaria subsp. sativa]|uniref:PGG domain-containing protein n=1 Tax=Eruca vesicaria subsp. sativa TaxID=29727 RepID=A0ABC8KJY3_ERUVS|nr:unnamed protein product [Eruca vesicaria subsp. sativa]